MDEDRFYAEQSRILQKLTDALIEATPEWWNRATLLMERGDDGFGYVIRNKDHPRDIVTPTDELYEAAFELQDLFESHGKLWEKATLKVVKVGDDWQYNIDYAYQE
jgi:hypothetical protein